MNKTICELFAGVGGFRLGFERINKDWQTVWFSQWEPGAKKQWAHDCYVSHFGNCLDLNNEYTTNKDIATINKIDIPDHTLLVGGFPCQDYSVANKTAEGIEGKKGVLWWQIRDVLISKHPSFCILENVDRIIKSPSNQKGRDFGIILSCFAEQNYSVEWRVVNAADYGAAQRRRRTFIFAYKNDTNYAEKINNINPDEIIRTEGFMAKSFPVISKGLTDHTILNKDIVKVSHDFSFTFKSAGYMKNYKIYTSTVEENKENFIQLKDILEYNVNNKYYIPENKINSWEYTKSSKKKERKTKDGYEYTYSEGKIAFPDYLDKPSRTILTSESSINRSSHVVSDLDTNNLRILTPKETERLQGFDDDWTNTGMPEKMRYFCMGNALVVPMITKMANVLDNIIEEENEESNDDR